MPRKSKPAVEAAVPDLGAVKLQAVLDSVANKYGKGAVMKAAAAEKEEGQRIPFNHPELDRMCGGGVPRGKITVIVGESSGGKSTSSLELIASAQKMGLRAALIEVEGAFDSEYAKCIGVNVDEMLFSQPSSAEEALDITEMLIKSGEIGLLVFDSIAAVATKAELEGSIEDHQMADKARLLSKAMRKLTPCIQDTNTAAVFLNQWRDNVGFGGGKSMPGGKALKFASSLTLDFARKETLKNTSGDPFGQISVVKVLKSRVGPPFAKGEVELKFPIYDGYQIQMGSGGFNRIAAYINAALDNGTLVKSGAWFKSRDGTNLAQGREKLIKLLETNEELLKSLL